jgi:GNAT superfamily N-acetyltransferase
MSVSIRPARPEDRDGFLTLLRVLTGQEPDDEARSVYDALVSASRGEMLVAEDEEAGSLLGIATVSYNLAIRYRGEYCQLEELVVDPSARGQNVGGLLVQAVVERARARGCAEIGLYLLERTEHNRPFYAKYGFEAVGTEMRQSLP